MTNEEKKAIEAQIAALENKAKVAAVVTSSGREQGARAIALMEANNGHVTSAQLATINAKYPGDPIYYARKEFGAVIQTNKKRNGMTTYDLRFSPADRAKLASLKASLQ